ncbi:MAG: 3-oxoacyl-ACP synthase [Pirellulaceae bacterium]|nr:MAG: 3-oxoacyl-ACP synthase [Pirellulaceae bacterium]
MGSRILGIATYLPEHRETIEDIRKEHPEWPIDKIANKTGIVARRLAAPDETAGDMGYQAASRLLERFPEARQQVDYLIYCSQSPDHLIPSTACVLQHRLGLAKSCGAFDFQLGCSGYVYGLQLAHALLSSGQARMILLVTSDTYSKYIHPGDRTVRMLFGDGAAATLVAEDPNEQPALGPFVVGTDGEGAPNLIVPAGGFRLPRSDQTAAEYVDSAGCVRTQDNLYMDGQAVFSFAISQVPPLVSATLDRAGLTVDDIDWFVYHQANRFMLENLAMCSRIPAEKMVYYMDEVGNTVSSSIPMAIAHYVEQGKILPGHRLLLVGFGVGYSWGACLVQWR